MPHKMFRAKINEAREELIECDPYITTMLSEASAIAGRGFGSGKIDAKAYEEYMEEIKKLAGDFRNKCSCTKKLATIPL